MQNSNQNQKKSFTDVINNQFVHLWLSEHEENNNLQTAIKQDMRKPIFKEEIHKKFLGLVGIFVFPVFNVLISHQGLLKLCELFQLNEIIAYSLSLIVPLSLEYAQYATIKPLCKKLAKKQPHTYKDFLDVSFFTFLIILLTYFGLITIASKVGGTAKWLYDYKEMFAIVLSLFFSFMTVYSHKSLANYFHKSVKEFIDLHPDFINPNVIELSNISQAYKLGLSSLIRPQIEIGEVHSSTQSLSFEAANNTSEHKKVIGFQSNNSIETNVNASVNNASVNNASVITNDIKLIVGSLNKCKLCGAEYTVMKYDHKFCCKNHRMQWHKQENGFDLALFNKSKK